MSIAISDALQQAQQAVEGGDYRSAVQTCNQLVNQYPDYAAAYRVLGEAYLEQGQTADAEQAFAQALLRDPRQPWAYHGLGLIAEGQEVLENALAFCQVAWELAPNQSRLRDPVIRIATRRFGADGHAQLTSAALAQIYASTSRLQRAASEYRSALADLPDRVDLKLGLAETLWQLNRNEEAAEISRQVLEENPAAIQALVVLADIEGRAGNDAEATDLRERIRAIDPDGSTTSMMLSRNEHANHDALLLSEDAIPVLADAADTGVAERPHIAPAPDFSYQPARAEHPVQDIEDLEPISAEEFGTEPDPAQADNLPTQGIADFETPEDDLVAFTSDAPSVFRTDDDADRLDLDQQVSAGESPSTTGDDAGDDDLDTLMAEFGDVEPMGIEEFGAEPEDLERLAAAAGQDLFSDDDDDMFAGFGPESRSDEGTNQHVRSLASALESDVAGALGRTGEFQIVPPQAETEDVDHGTEAEQEPELEVVAEAEVQAEPPTPDPLSGTGYTTVLRELGDEGFTPFDPMGRAELHESPAREQFAYGPGEGAETETPAEENELLKLTEDWESIDDEISRAVPLTTGQTDQLRAADDLGIDPFDFEIEDDTSRLPAFRPFGEDDDELQDIDADLEAASGDVQDDDELAVEDAPAPGPVEDDQVVEPEPETVQTASSDDDLFESLEPFSMEEFDNESASEQAFTFGALPWETGDSGSAVPSDEDMDLLLSSEDEPSVEPEIDEGAPPVAPDWPTTVLDTAPEQTGEPVDWTIAIQDDVTAENQPEPVLEVEHDPAQATWTPPDDWESSLAVTRQIGDPVDDDFAQRLSAAEAGAQAAQDQHEQGEDEQTPTSGLISGADPETLVADQDLFERTRSAKTDLISQGAISGDLDMAGSEQEPAPEPEPDMDQVVDELHAEEELAEDDFVVTTGSSRDVNTLRASLEAAPNDDELRWWLAEALRERGEIDEAYGEYRWIIRNAGHRSDDVINALNECIEQEQHAEMGHRLLADIYRRRGAVSLASSHAATAMAVRRRLRG
jgi:tetratricopeptide (TPR) repeat protein